MVRWMCGVKPQDRVPSKELRESLGLDDIISVLQQNRLQWKVHVLRKEDNDWVKKCTEYDVEGARPRGRPKKTYPGCPGRNPKSCKTVACVCVYCSKFQQMKLEGNLKTHSLMQEFQ